MNQPSAPTAITALVIVEINSGFPPVHHYFDWVVVENVYNPSLQEHRSSAFLVAIKKKLPQSVF